MWEGPLQFGIDPRTKSKPSNVINMNLILLVDLDYLCDDNCHNYCSYNSIC